MLPASGRTAPARIFISVLLPAPFSPNTAWIEPRPRTSETSRSARVRPKLLLTARTTSRAPASPGRARGVSGTAMSEAMSGAEPFRQIRLHELLDRRLLQVLGVDELGARIRARPDRLAPQPIDHGADGEVAHVERILQHQR